MCLWIVLLFHKKTTSTKEIEERVTYFWKRREERECSISGASLEPNLSLRGGYRGRRHFNNEGHAQGANREPLDGSPNKPTCYFCNKVGHMWRECLF
jgi:hypothetical protein